MVIRRLMVAAVASLGFCFMSGAASAGAVATPNGSDVQQSIVNDDAMTLVRSGGRSGGHVGGFGGGGGHFSGGSRVGGFVGGGPRYGSFSRRDRDVGGFYNGRRGYRYGRGYRRGGFFYGGYGLGDDYYGSDYGYGYGFGGLCYARCRQFRGPYFCRYNAAAFC